MPFVMCVEPGVVGELTLPNDLEVAWERLFYGLNPLEISDLFARRNRFVCAHADRLAALRLFIALEEAGSLW